VSRTTNWAGNVRFHARAVHTPASVAELQELVAGSTRVRALGTGHSFNAIADTTGDLVRLSGLPGTVVVDRANRTVTVAAGLRYAQLVERLEEAGLALANLGSLPHLSVAGAIATATHGSGDEVGNLATAVSALELVTASGELLRVSRRDGDQTFDGFPVGLGALGVVTSLTLNLVPTFEIRQLVYDELPQAAVEEHFEEVMASAYSVSMLTDWRRPGMRQVWVKQRTDGPDPEDVPLLRLGATLAAEARHPIPGQPADSCTEQRGIPGPWHARLPHFRAEFPPSSGHELQSEYVVPREHGVAALVAVAEIRELVAPVTQVAEVRTIRGDDLWLSPAHHRDCVALHFTWVPDLEAVQPVLRALEERLAPFEPRPHWGKLFTTSAHELADRYERYDDFLALAVRLDPTGKLWNEQLDEWFPGR
jgi:alditol oxidase